MEATFFRFLAHELGTCLQGRRIEKIFAPAPGVWTLKIQNKGEPMHLLFRPAKSAGHLFLSATKPANPMTAPARSMWFRKRVQNRIITGFAVDWPTLRLALALSPHAEPEHGTHLVLDCRNDLVLANTLEPGFGDRPDWPSPDDVLDDPDIWQEFPHISPPLRKVLAALPRPEAVDLYFRVASGDIDTFYLPQDDQPPLAWRTTPDDQAVPSALEAANRYGERTLFPLLEIREDKPDQTLRKRAYKRVRRNLARLDQEESRLHKLMDNKKLGEALQAELYRFQGQEGLETVEAAHPTEGPVTVPLNPYLSPAENMARYFKLAAKGERGMAHIARRRAELAAELDRLDKGEVPDVHPALAPRPASATPAAPAKYRGLAVSVFRSSDGFTILRGKNKHANHAMLTKAASPFDYWLHAVGGPSSHVILKRDHPSHEVPETTLREAAVLCGLKSWRSTDTKAEIMYALVKDVRKVKGFNPGQVMVDNTLGTLLVDLDPKIEKKLG